ncbi:flagellar motor switch protein FliM [uncultured Sulfitobacter sp.]|uniref:FliM/FliN family flagellar motor switch protein n=1 Tax=uncultured Sulfitobacter sp. TaxID=191468 RepID=UPI00260ED981|nr:flagellar motor switch protein FliM [uncultured Sulfitobacter sp.]
MSAEQTTSLMQRKARTGREAYAARAMSLGRALRLTAAKQAEQMMALALGVLGVTRRKLTAEEVPACLETPWLTMLMDGPADQVAAVMIDPALVTGLIQQQTMGKVTPVPDAGEVRAHTATDAALCAPFIEAVLARAALLPEEEGDRALLQGYRFGVLAKEPRHAQLALDASSYEMVEMTLDLAAGVRTGQLRLILPEPAAQQSEADGSPDDLDGHVEGQNLTDNVMGLNAELTIALTRLSLPLQQVSGLKAGDVIPLNLSTLAQALVLDANGKALSRGTLGQIDGVRALQVEQQRSRQHSEPRRRAADRADLDLPDVSATFGLEPAPSGLDEDGMDPVLPTLSDVDIFGDLDDLPEMPDMDEAAQAADDHMAQWDAPKEGSEEDLLGEKQAGW